MCLYFLDLLQYEHFRRELVNAQCAKFIDDQQILLWQHYTRRRSRLLTTPVSNGSTEQNNSTPNIPSNGHLNSKISWMDLKSDFILHKIILPKLKYWFLITLYQPWFPLYFNSRCFHLILFWNLIKLFVSVFILW